MNYVLNDRAEFAQVEIRMGGGPQVGGGGIPDKKTKNKTVDASMFKTKASSVYWRHGIG